MRQAWRVMLKKTAPNMTQPKRDDAYQKWQSSEIGNEMLQLSPIRNRAIFFFFRLEHTYRSILKSMCIHSTYTIVVCSSKSHESSTCAASYTGDDDCRQHAMDHCPCGIGGSRIRCIMCLEIWSQNFQHASR